MLPLNWGRRRHLRLLRRHGRVAGPREPPRRPGARLEQRRAEMQRGIGMRKTALASVQAEAAASEASVASLEAEKAALLTRLADLEQLRQLKRRQVIQEAQELGRDVSDYQEGMWHRRKSMGGALVDFIEFAYAAGDPLQVGEGKGDEQEPFDLEPGEAWGLDGWERLGAAAGAAPRSARPPSSDAKK
eukprot:Skav220378  [mRNA]  locus=scaffold5218:11302:17341:+ [translate_table: standard]